MKIWKHPIWTVWILWFWVTTPGTNILNIPRERGWHPLGVHLTVEDCREAAHQAAAELPPGKKVLACRTRPGIHGKILLIQQATPLQTEPDRQIILLQINDEDLNKNWRWVLWLYHKHNWTLRGIPMKPGWYAASVWSGLSGCADAWRRAKNVPLGYKKCLRADKFPGENAKILRDHM